MNVTKRITQILGICVEFLNSSLKPSTTSILYFEDYCLVNSLSNPVILPLGLIEREQESKLYLLQASNAKLTFYL